MTSRTFIAEKRAIRYIRRLEAVAARGRLMNPAEMMRLMTVALVALISTPAVADVPGSGDNALIPRYPGSEIIDYKVASFDEYRMAVGPRVGGKVESQRTEGKVTRIKYRLTPTQRSGLEVFRNYERALAEAGFEVVFRCTDEAECGTSFFYQIIYKINRMPIENIDSRYLVATLTRPEEGDMTVALAVQRRKLPSTKEMTVDVALDIVEAESMDVGMELKLADEMSREIGAQGRAVLYGILFDYDSANIKAGSAGEIGQIAELLNGDPALKLLVVGHTDNEGDLHYNIDLSERRAAAVVAELVAAHGIVAGRLSAHGVGYLAPAASNDTEKGRGANRRVELVKQ